MYATMAADIRRRRVIPREPQKLPKTGQALIVILEPATHRERWEQVRAKLGSLKLCQDPAAWQRLVRSEWDPRR